MAKIDDYLNKTVMTYWWNRMKTYFAGKTEFDALDAKVDEIISEGGEPNVIETVKVNGTALTPDAQKAVDIDLSDYAKSEDVPTKTSDLTNDGDGESNFATEAYVDENGGKIDVIKVNGTAQTITNKEVDIEALELVAKTNSGGVFCGVENPITHDVLNVAVMPNGNSPETLGVSFVHEDIKSTYSEVSAFAYTTTKTDTLLADKADKTTTYTKTEVDNLLSAAKTGRFKAVATLPTASADTMDSIYLVPASDGATGDVKDEYVTLEDNGTYSWEKIGSTRLDLSDYWAKEELVAITTQDIDTMMAA